MEKSLIFEFYFSLIGYRRRQKDLFLSVFCERLYDVGKKKEQEVSLSEACECLKVSEKTMRRYLSLRKINGKKVSGVWYIEKASLDLFKESKCKLLEPSAKSPHQPEKQEIASGINLHNLACYRLFLAALGQFNTMDDSEELQNYFRVTTRQALAFLGAGYVGYGRLKKINYEASRGEMGKLLAVIQSDSELMKRHSIFAVMLAKDVIPAFGPLIKKLDARNQKSEQLNNKDVKSV